MSWLNRALPILLRDRETATIGRRVAGGFEFDAPPPPPPPASGRRRDDLEFVKLARGVRDVVHDCMLLADDLTDALVSAEAAADSFSEVSV